MVHDVADGEYAVATDPAQGWLQSHDAVVGCRAQDGAAGLGADGQGRHPGGHGGAGAAAGASGGVTGVPGVVGRGGLEHGELGGDGLAQDDCACLLQPGDGGAVEAGDVAGPTPGAHFRRQPVGAIDVLDADGYAVEGRLPADDEQLVAGAAGGCQGPLAVHVGPCAQGVFMGVDAGQAGLRKFEGRQLAFVHEEPRLCGGQLKGVVCSHRRLRNSVGQPPGYPE